MVGVLYLNVYLAVSGHLIITSFKEPKGDHLVNYRLENLTTYFRK
jgi:hypothetical protein